MQLVNTFLVLSILLGLSGCASKPASYDYQTDYNYSALRTYTILPINKDVYNNPKVSEIEVKRIGSQLTRALNSRYSLASDAESADFLVRYFVVVEDRVRIDTFDAEFGMYPGYRYYHGIRKPEVRNTYYEQGAIIVDIIDSGSNEVIWRGSTEGRIKSRITPEERDIRVQQMLEELLSNFPPKTAQ